MATDTETELSTKTGSNRQVASNTVFLYTRMFVIMAISLYTSRVVLRELGVVDFGVYTAVGSVVTMLTFLTHSMSTATQRFLSFEIGRNDAVALKKTFSASLAAQLLLAVSLVVVLETLGIWYLNSNVNVPDDRANAAFWIFQLSILSFLFQMLIVPFNASIVACERMSFYAYVSIVEAILKLLVAFALSKAVFDKLMTYGILMTLVSCIVFLAYVLYCRRRFSMCRCGLTFNSQIFRRLLGFSGWTMLGSFADVSVVHGVNLLVNHFLGVLVNAALGIAQQVYMAVNSFVTNFQVAFRPQLIKSYAAGNTAFCQSLIIRSAKLSFVLLYVLTLPIILNADMLLGLWLDEVPHYANVLTQLILVPALIDAMAAPLWMTIQATGKIMVYQIVISLVLMLNLLFSYVFLKMGFQADSVLWTRICISAVALLVRIIFVSKLVGIEIKLYLKNVLGRVSWFCLFTLPLPVIIACNTAGWTRLMATTASVAAFSCMASYLIILDREERTILTHYIQISLKRCKQ